MGRPLKALMGEGHCSGNSLYPIADRYLPNLMSSVLQGDSPCSNLSFTSRTRSKKEQSHIALLRQIDSDLLPAVIKRDFLIFQRSKIGIHQSSIQLIQA